MDSVPSRRSDSSSPASRYELPPEVYNAAGKVRRAPLIVQRLGFEWLWRLLMEPRRLFWRYLTTNPRALYAILRNSR